MSTVEPDQVNTCVGIKPNKNPAQFYPFFRINPPSFLVVLDSLMSFIRIIAMNHLTNLSAEISAQHEQDAKDLTRILP
jgi:hypothetical protein